MKKEIRIMIYAILFFVLLVPNAFCQQILKMATTTSTYETGLLDSIIPPFEERENVKLHIISVGTGKAIKLGENGDVDIILVHARGAEDEFVNNGYGVNRQDVMYNDFVIAGPKEDLAEISGYENVGNALKKIFDSKATFISRGDNSGTHKKEMSLWKESELSPEGTWYLESGQGMSATFRMADEKNAYVLVDRATYLANQDNVRLEIIVEGDEKLFNPYGVIAVDPDKHPHINYELSMKLIAWLTSSECQKMIGEYQKNGHKLFVPNANPSVE